jgi:hypothetical protein
MLSSETFQANIAPMCQLAVRLRLTAANSGPVTFAATEYSSELRPRLRIQAAGKRQIEDPRVGERAEGAIAVRLEFSVLSSRDC